MPERKKSPLAAAALVYVAFVGLVAAANLAFGGPPAAPGRSAAGTVLLWVGAVTVVGIVAPLWLAARGRLTLPVWAAPGTGDNALAVLLVVFLFARIEMLAAVVAEGRPWGPALATFLGAAAFHLASITATIGVLLPALKRHMPPAPAAGIAAAAWALYYVAQSHTSAGGVDGARLVAVVVFGLGYALYYFWSRSLILTALLHHLVSTTTYIYNRDFSFGAPDVRFFYGLAVLVAYVAFVAAKRRTYAAERFTYF
jgi:membrane protease YdiL (CAAX protease family)